jgi:hypothetical protein
MARKSQMDRKGEEVISCLLRCGTLAEAARQSEISESTILRWLKEPEFASQYRQARRAQLELTFHAVARSATTAIATLLQVMQSPDKFSSARVSAARAVLDLALRLIEIDDFEQRLAAVEAREEAEEHEHGR